MSWIKLEIQIDVADGTQQLGFKEIVNAALNGMRELRKENIYTKTDWCPIRRVGEAKITTDVYHN